MYTICDEICRGHFVLKSFQVVVSLIDIGGIVDRQCLTFVL